jgi:alpha-beta hydrolase superfamily lysophospholipase
MPIAPLFAASSILIGAALAAAALVIFVNWVIYRHARAMTHFVRGAAPAPAVRSLRHRLRQALAGPTMPRRENLTNPADFGLPYEVHEFPGRSGLLSAWHVPHPAPRGLVLLFHGYHGCKSHVLPETKAFHELGFACLLTDFPGCGDSDGHATTIGRRESRDVARTVEYARGRWGGGRLVLFGASMGAAAILRAVARHGVAADAVILECPFDRLVNAVAVRCRLLRVPAFPTAHLLVLWGGLRLGFNGFRHNPAEYARGVRCPVLLMCGTRDPKVTRDQVEAIRANLAGERAVHYFEGLEHESYVAKRPEEWRQQVRRFLGESEAAALKAS